MLVRYYFGIWFVNADKFEDRHIGFANGHVLQFDRIAVESRRTTILSQGGFWPYYFA